MTSYVLGGELHKTSSIDDFLPYSFIVVVVVVFFHEELHTARPQTFRNIFGFF